LSSSPLSRWRHGTSVRKWRSWWWWWCYCDDTNSGRRVFVQSVASPWTTRELLYYFATSLRPLSGHFKSSMEFHPLYHRVWSTREGGGMSWCWIVDYRSVYIYSGLVALNSHTATKRARLSRSSARIFITPAMQGLARLALRILVKHLLVAIPQSSAAWRPSAPENGAARRSLFIACELLL